jgi:hypothetical protein
MSDVPEWMPKGVLPVLSEFDGKKVLSTSIAITGAGDGLSKAMAIEPQEMHHGQTVIVVSECVVNKVRFDPIKDTDGLQRVHVLRAGTSTIMDGDVVREALRIQKAKIDTAAALAEGKRKLPTPEALQEEHDAGDHTYAVAGCPTCDSEAAVHAAEQDDAEGAPVRPIGEGARRRTRRPKGV